MVAFSISVYPGILTTSIRSTSAAGKSEMSLPVVMRTPAKDRTVPPRSGRKTRNFVQDRGFEQGGGRISAKVDTQLVDFIKHEYWIG